MEIKIRPSKKQMFSGSFSWILLNILSVVGFIMIPKSSILALFPLGYLVATVLTIACRWMQLRFYSWIITQEVILQKRGLFTLVTDHVELYRIADYQETQNFCQRILGIKTLHLIGRDQMTKVISIQGIPSSSNLMHIVRERVELCRTNKGIYEVLNN